MKYLLLILGFSATVALAAPTANITRSLIPEANNQYFIGTSSPSALQYNGIFNNVTVNGTCAGCGGGGGTFDWTVTPLGNATDTLLLFRNGFISNASSSVGASLNISGTLKLPLTLNSLAVDANGNVYGSATTTFNSPLTYSAGVVSCATCALTTSLFGEAFSIDSSNYLSATTTNSFGINANSQGTTYGYGIGDRLLIYASSTNANLVFGVGAGGQGATTSPATTNVTAFGFNALQSNTTGTGLVAIGSGALGGNTSGLNNVAIGFGALQKNTTLSSNVAIGQQAMNNKIIAADSVAIGRNALQNASGANGTQNVAIGSTAGAGSTGNNNTYIGTFTGGTTTPLTGSNNLLLGFDITVPAASSNVLDIGNLIYGTGINGEGLNVSTGNIGIGTSTPNWNLQVAGTRPFFTLSDMNAGTNQKHWFLSSQGGNLYVGTTTDSYATTTGYQFLTMTTQSLQGTNFGRLGIGTTSPYAQLSIHDTNATTSLAKVTLFAIGSTTSTGLFKTVFEVTSTGSTTAAGRISDGSGIVNPSGMVAFFDLSACPSGWTASTTLQGRYLVGVPSGGNLGANVGTALTNKENRATGSHTHSYFDAGIAGAALIPNGAGTLGQPAETAVPTGASNQVAGTNAPYAQLLVCRKD